MTDEESSKFRPALCRDKRLDRGGVVRGASIDVARPTSLVEWVAMVHLAS